MPARSLASRASGVPTYVDGGAQVCLITEDTARRLQLKINRKHAYNITMENNAVVRCVGVVEQVELYLLSFGGFAYHAYKAKGFSTNTWKNMVNGYKSKPRLALWGIRIIH